MGTFQKVKLHSSIVSKSFNTSRFFSYQHIFLLFEKLFWLTDSFDFGFVAYWVNNEPTKLQKSKIKWHKDVRLFVFLFSFDGDDDKNIIYQKND